MEYDAAYTYVYTTEDFTARNWFKRKGPVSNMNKRLVEDG